MRYLSRLVRHLHGWLGSRTETEAIMHANACAELVREFLIAEHRRSVVGGK